MDRVALGTATTLSAPDDPVEQDQRAVELRAMREVVGNGRVWHVNSTARGGGVAEMLSSLLPSVSSAGIDVRWIVIDGSASFFEVTKRIHNRLHDDAGDGGMLDEAARAVYDECLATQAAEFCRLIAPGDVVVLHDPQTAGLAGSAKAAGASVVWRCHVGVDTPGSYARSAAAFLRPYVECADAVVFSRRAYVWDTLRADRVAIIPPCIDVRSPKNRRMDGPTRDGILEAARLVATGVTPVPTPAIRPADVVEEVRVSNDVPLVVQVSRWDRLKDHEGVLGAVDAMGDAHLMLAGPMADAVDDDPEGAETFASLRQAWEGLRPDVRRRVHLASLPMDDAEANALVVNALQRRADVVAQKSLAEGFGLTVTEAMWKARAVVASRVGGIADQIVDGESGLLVDDPTDLNSFGQAVRRVLRDRELAVRLAAGARARVATRFLPQHYFANETQLFRRVMKQSGTVRPLEPIARAFTRS